MLLPYGVDHGEAHLHAAAGVASLRLGDARDAVVTVAEDLDTQTLMLLNAAQSTQNESLINNEQLEALNRETVAMVT